MLLSNLMRSFPKLLSIFITVWLLPTLIVYPHADIPILQENASNFNQVPPVSAMTYDDVMELIEDVESGEAEDKYSPADLDKILHLIVTCARAGVLPNQPEEALSIENDIEQLFYEEGYEGSFGSDYLIVPTIFYGKEDFVLCKGFFKKAAHKTGHFIKKHKKAVIVGAAVVVAVVTVVGITVAVAAGASAAAAAAAERSHSSKGNNSPTSFPTNAPAFQASVEDNIATFKENVATEHFFEISPAPLNKENGRVLGSLFAHDSFKNLSEQFLLHPLKEIPQTTSHKTIDRKFSTDYTSLYSQPQQEPHFNTLAYQSQGEKALDSGYLHQAIYDFNKAIELTPSSPLPYLERSFAHFGLGQYDKSLEDYHHYTTQVDKTQSFSVPAFSLGFAKGLPQGIWESGAGLSLFVSNILTHPIRTGGQVWESLSLLGALAKAGEWNTLREVLAPEVHQLVKEWDILPPETRGELAGHAFGKYGSDIIIPGALAKAIGKGLKGAHEIGAIYKSLQTAEKTLLLEAASELGNGAKVGETLHATYTTALIGEELGLSVSEMTQLKQAGNLEKTVQNIANNPALLESAHKFAHAKKALKPHAGKYMAESEARERIQALDIPTFPRPKGIPDNFKITISDKGAGMEYGHPTNTHVSVRVMPGQPHSQFPNQQKTYVVQIKDGKAFDKYGNLVEQRSSESHIPFEEFIYRE